MFKQRRVILFVIFFFLVSISSYKYWNLVTNSNVISNIQQLFVKNRIQETIVEYEQLLSESRETQIGRIDQLQKEYIVFQGKQYSTKPLLNRFPKSLERIVTRKDYIVEYVSYNKNRYITQIFPYKNEFEFRGKQEQVDLLNKEDSYLVDKNSIVFQGKKYDVEYLYNTEYIGDTPKTVYNLLFEDTYNVKRVSGKVLGDSFFVTSVTFVNPTRYKKLIGYSKEYTELKKQKELKVFELEGVFKNSSDQIQTYISTTFSGSITYNMGESLYDIKRQVEDYYDSKLTKIQILYSKT